MRPRRSTAGRGQLRFDPLVPRRLLTTPAPLAAGDPRPGCGAAHRVGRLRRPARGAGRLAGLHRHRDRDRPWPRVRQLRRGPRRSAGPAPPVPAHRVLPGGLSGDVGRAVLGGVPHPDTRQPGQGRRVLPGGARRGHRGHREQSLVADSSMAGWRWARRRSSPCSRASSSTPRRPSSKRCSTSSCWRPCWSSSPAHGAIDGRSARGRLIAFGAVLGLSALLRPNTLLFVPLAVVVWLVVGAGWRRSLMQALWVTLAAVVVVSPWIIRNAVRLDAPVFSTGSGDAFCVGHHPGASGRYELAIADCLKPYDHYPFPEREVKRNSGNTRKRSTSCCSIPREEASLWFWRGLLRLSRRPRGDQRPFPAQQLPRCPLAAGPHDRGRRLLLRRAGSRAHRPPRLRLAASSPSAVRPALHGLPRRAALPLCSAIPRYKVPVLPFLAVSAAVSLSMLVDRVRARRPPEEGEPVANARERRLTLSPSCRRPRPPARARRAPR